MMSTLQVNEIQLRELEIALKNELIAIDNQKQLRDEAAQICGVDFPFLRDARAVELLLHQVEVLLITAKKEEEKKVVCKKGDTFIDTLWHKQEYVLAQITNDTVCLIDLKTGNRFIDPVKVENSRAITAEEFYKITNGRPDTLKPKPKHS